VFDPGSDREVAAGAIPKGLCSVDVELVLTADDDTKLATHELQLVAGLCGVEQSDDDASVTPTIGWCLADRPPAEAASDERRRRAILAGG